MIDGLALSCFGLRSPYRHGQRYLNLVSHGDKMTAPRTHMVLCTFTESVRDKVCLLAYQAACILTHLHEAILATKSCGRRVVQPWTHCRPPACLSWNCRVQEFRAHVVQHTAWHRHCKRHVCVLQLGECRRCGATCLSSSCVVCHLLVTELL